MKISYSCYKYAPETAAATVNGLKIDLHNTNIGYLIATGNHTEAEKAIKEQYRKHINRENNFTYCFYVSNSNQFYYISQLNFKANADLKSRFYCYKELKHYLQNHPIEITTESGHIIPGSTEKPEVKKEVVKIDFNKCKKIKIA